MVHRRLLQFAVAAATLVSPLAAWAQIAGSVTTAPVGQPAPALAMPMLVVLAIALVGLGFHQLRTHGASRAAGFALVVGLSLLAGLSYAGFSGAVVIEGGDCTTQTTHSYDPNGATLTSLCPNLIQIIAIDAPCDGGGQIAQGAAVTTCIVGETLANGQVCTLEGCS